MPGNSFPFHADMIAWGRARVGHWPVGAFIFIYAALLLLQLNHGLASLDAHGVVRVVQDLIENHLIGVSRPPGHPTTEFYLLGSAGWLFKTCGYGFTDVTYLAFQGLGALATLAVFYEMVCRLGAASWQALLATACLGFSPQFFSNAVDGEEFVFALLFLFLAVRFLMISREVTPGKTRVFLSIFCFALATGCRPEIAFAGLIYPVFCGFHPKLGWKIALAILPLLALAVVLVWLPVLLTDFRQPYTAGMNLRESLLGGGYRLVFQCFTPPGFVFICWILVVALLQAKKRMQDLFPGNFIFLISCLTPLIFFGVFFLHASKAAHVLAALPFVLLLALRCSPALLAGLAAATLFGSIISLDLFQERRLVRPFFIPGSYFQAIQRKPYYKFDYLRLMTGQCSEGSSAIVADAWTWDIDYQIAHRKVSWRRQVVTEAGESDLAVFFPGTDEGCVLLPREAALRPTLLENWHSRGYSIRMDALLHRTLFARYDVTTPGVDSATIGNIPVSLVTIPSSHVR